MSRNFYALISALFIGLVSNSTPASACPNPELTAAKLLRENGASLRRGKASRIFAGGKTTLADCTQLPIAEGVRGTFSDAPSLRANLVGMMGLAAEINVVSNCETSLLIRTADGAWYYDDNGKGQGIPRLVLSHPGTGEIDIWVGTRDGSTCRARLSIVTYLRQS